MQLSTKILIGMLAGIMLGSIFNLAGTDTGLIAWLNQNLFDVVGKIFINSLKLMVVPLVFISIVCGAAAMGADIRMGRIAIKTLLFYLFTTAIAITLALLFANLTNPGMGLELEQDIAYSAATAPPFKEVLINMFPTNPVSAMAEGNMLQIIVFSLLMGVALSLTGDKGSATKSVFESMNEVVMKMVTILMHLAPWGVFALLVVLFSEMGFSAIQKLATYFFTVAFVLLLHLLVTYGGLLQVLGRLSFVTFIKNIRPAMMFAFSTSSSGATIPVSLNVAEKRLGVDNGIASFTVPLGATINMDGTAIMQGVATVFIAQAFQVDIGLGGYLAVIATATLASIGTAAVPGVGLITLSMVLNQVGLPVEGIALIIGVDRLLDMMRTAVNISGDLTVTTVVAKSEGMLDEAVFNDVSDLDSYEHPDATKE